MPRSLRLSDFRARRRLLLSSDFALAGPRPRSRDRINASDWFSIVDLPDDVAILTSNLHGTAISRLHALWGAWGEMAGDRRDPMWWVMLDARDDFQAGIFNLLVGYYRLCAAALRSALELSAIGAWAQKCHRSTQFRRWRMGECELSLGMAADGLIGPLNQLETRLESDTGGSLFRQKASGREAGSIRRLFSLLSDYTHSRPGYTDADMRNSNGPIYLSAALRLLSSAVIDTFAASCVLALIARPRLILPEALRQLCGDRSLVSDATLQRAIVLLYAGRC